MEKPSGACALLPLLNDRSEGAVEFKHQNISAVLKGLGEDWIPGYKPAFNFQMTLVDAVARWLALNPAWLGRQPGLRPASGLHEAAPIWIVVAAHSPSHLVVSSWGG
ncbi:hypothetical protein [Parvibaculum sp.]|uniref:hypothetical protein n=1 Tax=Parvibaculum sp. TaxID=2024848 RepID=UPI00320C1C1C